MKFYCRTSGSRPSIESRPSQGPVDLQDVSTQPVQCDPDCHLPYRAKDLVMPELAVMRDHRDLPERSAHLGPALVRCRVSA